MNELKRGKVIAAGSYGTVYELVWHGMKFAGKTLHDYIVPGPGNVFPPKFLDEIDLLTKIRHPRIVQLIHVQYPKAAGSPLLVMEYLPTTLAKAVNKYKSLPDEIAFSIFEDIALGICFLHGLEPAVIHRDLSPNNILLDDNMRAKIADLGMAKLLDLSSGKPKMSQMPGTAVFMPPEARKESPDYKTDIDIFSFGVLMVFVFSAKWPDQGYEYPKDPLEFDEKWLPYIEKVRHSYPSVLSLVKQCLSRPAGRPSAMDVLKRIREEKATVQVYHGSKVRMIQQRELDRNELQRLRNDREKDVEIGRLNAEVETLTREKENDHTEKGNMRSDIDKLESLNNIKSEQIKTKDELLDKQREVLKQKEEELKIERDRVQQKKQELDSKESEKQDAEQYSQSRVEYARAERDQAWQQMSSGEQFHLLHSNSILTWETLNQRTSISMTAPQYTIIGYNLYFGGGQTDDDKHYERNRIFKFDINTGDHTVDLEQSLTASHDSHTTSEDPIQRVEPDCPAIHFGLGNIGGKLVAVGGREQQGISSKVLVLEKKEDGTSEWSKDTIKASLSIPRSRVCVISQTEDEHSTSIAACGGRVMVEGKEVSTDLVEVYHKDSPTWTQVKRLPVAGAALRATVLHNNAYVLGGWADPDMKKASTAECIAVNKDNLFDKDSQVSWKSLPKLPTRNAAPGHLCGTLLALGGIQPNDQPTEPGKEAGPTGRTGTSREEARVITSPRNFKPVLAFNSNTQEWIRVAILPKAISSATAASLPNGKLIFFGGWEKEKVDSKRARNTDIFIAKVTGRMFSH